MHWLSPLNLWESHHRILNTWQVGTGDWLLDHTLFREWHFGQGNLLFCPGIPGAGKTVFASLIVNHLWTTYEKDDKIGVGFIYCNYKDREQQTLVNLVGALLSQLASKKMPKELVKLYEKHGLLQRSRPQRVFIDALASLLHRCSKTFIIVDALDEYADPQELMGELFRLQQRVTDWGCVLKLLVTSRETGTISKLFKNAAKIEIQAREEDIRTYLRAEFEKNVRLQMHMKKEPALILEIIDTIVRKAEGM
ncbi:hypothetical protein BDZ91DRAFT_665305 [Kalaharituber pfeilii]|nr:hypothetical protein BDZ91DRAFT_665305 [Kalaharituber pfeilii]